MLGLNLLTVDIERRGALKDCAALNVLNVALQKRTEYNVKSGSAAHSLPMI